MIERAVRNAAASVARIAANAAAGLSRDALNRRVLYRLSIMSDPELRDIGLTRYDVSDAASLQSGDATHFLIARRDSRRTACHRRYPF